MKMWKISLQILTVHEFIKETDRDCQKMTVSEFVSEETKRRIGFMMKFTKMQAFGNDYVYIDAIHQELTESAGTGKVCK